MSSERIVLVPDVVLPLALLAVVVAGWAGASGRLRRNHLVGIRIPSTLVSDAAWRAGHRASIAPGAIGFLLAAIAGAVGIASSGRAAVVIATTLVVVAVFVASVLAVVVRASRAARAAG